MTTPSHETFREELLDLAYGELGRRETRALKQHLEGCPDCRAELERMTATRSAMSGLADEPAPARGEAILLAAARQATQGREQKPFLPRWVWGASASAAVALALAVVSVKLFPTSSVPALKGPAPELVASSPQPPAAEPAPTSQPEGAPAPLAGKLAKAEAATAKPRPAAPAEVSRSFTQPPPASVAETQDGKDQSQPQRELRLDANRRELDLADEARARAVQAEKKKGVDRTDLAASPPPAASFAAPPQATAPAKKRDEREATLAVRSAAPAAANPVGESPDLDTDEMLGLAKGQAVDKRSAAELKRPGGGPAANAAAATLAKEAPEDAMSREARLQAAGRLRTETRTFADCPGESERVVDLDEHGTPVKLTRRGAIQGKPYTAELFYGVDGALEAARFSSEGQVEEFHAGPPRTSSGAKGVPAAVLYPQRAADAGPDAPPRCAF